MNFNIGAFHENSTDD